MVIDDERGPGPRRRARPRGTRGEAVGDVLEPAPIAIADGTGAAAPFTPGAGNPYPSTVSVAGFSRNPVWVRVTLNGVTHPRPDDLDILLEGPGGRA